ncbi:hypothetical protein [Spirobacillus cienkowskii]|jgi:hypothetical protein|uniref:DUF1049 domain-containing protein n=1 Tax=Spirobacillus cienkowskii TaxID=495820 RepID=A0A369KV98_9BACT|nr:MAG: hypothetical protein DCC88_09145 [Spirobacillus cienkowskii]
MKQDLTTLLILISQIISTGFLILFIWLLDEFEVGKAFYRDFWIDSIVLKLLFSLSILFLAGFMILKTLKRLKSDKKDNDIE